MRPSKLATTIALGLAVGVPAALAHDGATGIVKERMDLMESMGRASKGISRALRGEGALDRQSIVEAARRIVVESRKMLPTFPPDSYQDPSRAQPAIWSEWDDFKAGARDLEAASAELLAVAQTGNRDGLSNRFDRMVRVCISCHRAYRKPHG